MSLPREPKNETGTFKRDKPEALSVPATINQVWSMDFVSDSLTDGRLLRSFKVLDDDNREGLCIEVDLSLPSARVIRSSDSLTLPAIWWK